MNFLSSIDATELPVTSLDGDELWYKDAIIYQLHVKAFADSNNDGIGDFAGLTEKLGYLQELGVTALWLLPFYPSPGRDDGYDIADYGAINPDFGTMKDFKRFIVEAKRRGLRVITELVINHTSDQHDWFKRARRSDPKSSARNWYVWSDTDQKYLGTRIIFTDTEKSNWTWDPEAGQFYWHRFFSHQPDLNFDNPRVVSAIMKVMKRWLDTGVDGFRLDAIPYLCERDGTNNENLPETHAIIRKLRAELDAYAKGKVLLAEANQWPEDVQEYFGHPTWPKKSSRGKKSAHDQAAEMGPPPVPDLTLDGQHSLTRALGLKIGRIVIDAGHGGHDTGTIGPTGLMEKDLCLDVALRLGKIIQQKLPSAEVVLTRSDDTFVPLERRTEIANEAKADLFVSVHANSSQDNKARGIETYYLNFTGSSDAMEVASRENAPSGNAVHDLQDIVKKIASNEKIEESRDLASMIQDSLAKRMENINRGERNRGVRKAPFVVLIGADMPSVLAEISFLSNPSDETWLKRPENRQRVADGLYHGIETYLHSTNSLTSNQIRSTADNLAGKVARSGNSQ